MSFLIKEMPKIFEKKITNLFLSHVEEDTLKE